MYMQKDEVVGKTLRALSYIAVSFRISLAGVVRPTNTT
ncbi:unnamed protein product [Penicillium roqueforti FM164]|uniref:Genomic scaffold, ProqFM164S03 n=1 Tax=Penicillium roqueforti (strain FM164) TaxID=1365484 RepID=W6QZ97_PENRF|nr:unnamed protein product [Penicillium roqueforti FM164]